MNEIPPGGSLDQGAPSFGGPTARGLLVSQVFKRTTKVHARWVTVQRTAPATINALFMYRKSCFLELSAKRV